MDEEWIEKIENYVPMKLIQLYCAAGTDSSDS